MQREGWRSTCLQMCLISPATHRTWRQNMVKRERIHFLFSSMLTAFNVFKAFGYKRYVWQRGFSWSVVTATKEFLQTPFPSLAPQRPLLLSLAADQEETASVEALVATKHHWSATSVCQQLFEAGSLLMPGFSVFKVQVCNVKNSPGESFFKFYSTEKKTSYSWPAWKHQSWSISGQAWGALMSYSYPPVSCRWQVQSIGNTSLKKSRLGLDNLGCPQLHWYLGQFL